MAGKTKKIGLVILALVLAAAVAGYFLWNKPHTDVSSSEGIKVDAAALYQAFMTDSSAANTIYVDKVVEVTGTVKKISLNQQEQTVVVLQTSTGDAAINCTVEQKNAGIKETDKIKLKGICTGLGEGDTDLGIPGDVYLIRCYLTD